MQIARVEVECFKVRELAYMKAVAQHGKEDWRTNLGLKPEPDDEGLYTETQVQQLRESFEQSITDPENQPSQYGTVPLEWHLAMKLCCGRRWRRWNYQGQGFDQPGWSPPSPPSRND